MRISDWSSDVCSSDLLTGCHGPVAMRITASASRITMVRTKVAKSELTFSTPTLAKIAVSAAKAADNSAQNGHERRMDFIGISLCELPDDKQAEEQGRH